MSKLIFFFLIVGIIGIISAELLGVEIEHNPPREFINSEPIILRVKIFDLADYEIKCFYKFNDAEEYSVVELDKIGRRMFRTEIMPKENSNNIKYYFWIYKNNQFFQTLPKSNAVGIPFSIINTQEDLDYFSLLSPLISQEKLKYKKEMMFLVKNNFPNAIRFKSALLNDDESLKIINKKKVLINLQSTFPIRQGTNRLEIKGILADGTVVKQNFEFKTEKLKKKRLFKKMHEIKLNNNFYNTNKSEYIQNDSEILYSIKRAGATAIITYSAVEIAKKINKK